jgi:peptidoglycan/LPS O-acetylase OafA/YrhL
MGLLRFLFAMSVVIVHSRLKEGEFLIGSTLALKAFFVFSGFFMAFVLQEKYFKKKHAYMTFIRSRFLRIYPSYWIVLFLTICVVVITRFDSHTINWYYDLLAGYATHLNDLNIVTLVYFILTNLFIFGQDLVVFLGLNTSNGTLFFTSNFWITNPAVAHFLFLPQCWFLALNLYFYVLAPFIVKRSVRFLSLLILISLAIRVLLQNMGLNYDPWTDRLFPSEFVFFLFGIISYKFYTKIKNVQITPIISLGIFILGLLGTVFYYQIPPLLVSDNPPIPGNTLNDWIYLIVLSILMPFIFKFTKHNQFDTWLGKLSYAIFISHFIIIETIRRYEGVWGIRYPDLTMVLSTIVISIVLMSYIIAPIEKFRTGVVRNAEAIP